MTEPLVLIEHLVKSYRRGDQVVEVLRDISLSIPAGAFTALMGPSGSGKSTLLNLIAGIDKPDRGVLRIAGRDIAGMGETELAAWRATNVGFIFQFYNLMPVLTAFENVELPLLLTPLSRRERRERVALTLEMVNLADRMDHTRAIVSDPTLIVADEPTGDLDRHSAAEILALLQQLNQQLGKTVIMVTHDAQAAAQARNVVHLEKGELLADEPQRA